MEIVNVIAITQARIGSTRLPSKVLKKIGNNTLLEIHLNRINKAQCISNIIVATTINIEDDAIEELINPLRFTLYRGSENDVLDRFYSAVKDIKPDYIVRLTSDCPLIDPQLIDDIVNKTIQSKVDYCSNTLLDSYPDGQDIEVFTFKALEIAWQKANLLSEREHVTPYIKKNSSFNKGSEFMSINVNSENEKYKDVRMTVDEPKDLEMVSLLIQELGEDDTWKNYAELYLNNEKIHSLNKNILRNEGYLKSIKNDN